MKRNIIVSIIRAVFAVILLTCAMPYLVVLAAWRPVEFTWPIGQFVEDVLWSVRYKTSPPKRIEAIYGSFR